MELRNTLESLLFSSGKKMNVNDLAKLASAKDTELVKKTLIELKKYLEEKESSLILFQDGDFWQLTVRERYIPFVRKIVTKTELLKTVLETLAVVAYKAPVRQSSVIKIRTNKAYEHLKELENLGYITRVKDGRTKLIKLAQKFYDYFDLDREKLKKEFSNIGEIGQLETQKKTNAHEIATAELLAFLD